MASSSTIRCSSEDAGASDGVAGAWRIGVRMGHAVVMEIQITDDARKVLAKKGGTMSIDYIKALG